MYCILITNKWTNHKYLYPVVYDRYEDANKAILGWNHTNSIFNIKSINQ